MKLIIFIGNANHHKFLAQEINKKHHITKIFIDKKVNTKNPNSSLINKITSVYISHTWKKLMNFYKKKLNQFPSEKISFVDDINYLSEKQLSNYEYDFVIVSGTSLLRKKLIKSLGAKRILNLHTGLSPYVNGGPNCTNWCIAKGDFHLIGNTVMWLDEGIDSGNIISSEKTKVKHDDEYFNILKKVVENGHKIYLEVINNLDKNLHSVKQEKIGVFKTYYTRQWNSKNHIKLYLNLIFRFQKKVGEKDSIHTVKLKY